MWVMGPHAKAKDGTSMNPTTRRTKYMIMSPLPQGLPEKKIINFITSLLI
jgi:hypothetical protein